MSGQTKPNNFDGGNICFWKEDINNLGDVSIAVCFLSEDVDGNRLRSLPILELALFFSFAH